MARDNRLQHVNVMVDDLTLAIDFYGSALGLAALPTPDLGFPAQFFRINDHQEIHVNELDDITPQRAHYCLRVDDFTGHFHRMRALGAIETTTWGKAKRLPSGVLQLFVRDPSGNLIELSCDSDEPVDPTIFNDHSIFEPVSPEPS